MKQIRLLPLVMGCAGILFAMKAVGVVEGTIALVGTPAVAAEQAPAKAAEKPAPAQTTPAPAPTGMPGNMSETEKSIYRDLSKRRGELDKREGDLTTREQYLLVTERRVDQKINELKALQKKLDELVKAGEEKQNQRLASIVKMYETMKPKDAAQIFEKLDLPVQMEVATRMKEAKMAPILAAMSPDAAKTLTTEMASRARLPVPGA